MKYVPTIGLEVHVQLDTRSKMFCACGTGFGAEPNTHVCPVCLGYPGALPVMNEEAVRLTVLTGLMIGSTISDYSRFDRKSYFYPDMPKNYQISQYDRPLCVGGRVEIDIGGKTKSVRILRIHLEEDVGKNMHFRDRSGVDFNRAGIPLMEIVTEPDLDSPEEALAFLNALKSILLYARVSHCNLEEGNLRCDVNCSLRPEGNATLGTKAEIKNLNTFKGVLHALQYEVVRQREVLDSGERIRQETRRWDVDQGVTTSMRSKEQEHDYRYFPEPDLMPVVLSKELVDTWKAQLPEPPRDRRRRFMDEFGIPEYDAGVLVADRDVAEFFEAAARRSENPKGVSNWVMTEMLRLLGEKEISICDIPCTPEALAELVALADKGTVNSTTAKDVFAVLLSEGGSPEDIVRKRGWTQVSDSDALVEMVDKAVTENPKSAEDFRKGKKAALQFLVGQVMRQSRGKANPQMAAELLKKRLSAS